MVSSEMSSPVLSPLKSSSLIHSIILLAFSSDLRSTLIMSQTPAVLQPSELQISHGPIKTLSLSLRQADVPGMRVNEWAQGPPYAYVMSPAPVNLSHVLRRGRC